MPALIWPTIRLRDSWLASREEWGGVHQDGSGLHPEDDVDTVAGFAAWVDWLGRQADTSARTIEKCDAVLEDVRDTELGRIRRYWITL